MAARVLSIGCGVGEKLVTELRRVADELESSAGESRLEVEGNGDDVPPLVVLFVDEGDPEWTEPCVDYREE